MNLFDALKTGRRFRQVNGPSVCEWRTKESLKATLASNMIGHQSRPCVLLTLEQLTSDDWEVEEELSLSITEEQVRIAYGTHCRKFYGFLSSPEDELCRLLGFK